MPNDEDANLEQPLRLEGLQAWAPSEERSSTQGTSVRAEILRAHLVRCQEGKGCVGGGGLCVGGGGLCVGGGGLCVGGGSLCAVSIAQALHRLLKGLQSLLKLHGAPSVGRINKLHETRGRGDAAEEKRGTGPYRTWLRER